MMSALIIGIGEALWDVLPDGKKIGGAPANFAYHVSQFGLDGCAISAIGYDVLGDEIIDVFNKKNLHDLLPRVDYPTGTVQVTLDKEGIPCYDIKRDVAWDHIPLTSEMKNLAHHAQAICFGSLAQRSLVSRTTIAEFIDAIPEDEGQLKIFDINLRQNFYDIDIITESLHRSNVLKINDDELLVLSEMFNFTDTDLENRCKILLDRYNLKMLILTCGVNGSYVFTPGNVSFQVTPKVTVVDTIGAGDSFTATFCTSILKGKSIEEAHKLAVDVSAFVCTQHGAMPVLPADLLNRVNA